MGRFFDVRILSIPTHHPFNVASPCGEAGSAVGGDGVYPSQCTFSLAGKMKVLAITVYPIPFFAFLRVRDAAFVCDSNSNVTSYVRSPFALWAKFH